MSRARREWIVGTAIVLVVVSPAVIFLALSIGTIRYFTPPEPEGVQIPMGPDGEPITGVPLGEFFFQTIGCQGCHGPAGEGGLVNPNYLKGTYPTLATLADRIFLYDPEDAEVVIELLVTGADLQALLSDPPFRTYNRFVGQMDSLRNILINGRDAGKLDPEGPDPVDMPPFEHRLDATQRDAVIAYLISLFPWDDDW